MYLWDALNTSNKDSLRPHPIQESLSLRHYLLVVAFPLWGSHSIRNCTLTNAFHGVRFACM